MHSLLKYVTTILVRNYDIIAAMAHKNTPPLSSAATFSEAPAYQINILRTQPLASGTFQTDQDEALPAAITAVANPTTMQEYRNGPYKDLYFQTVSPTVNCLEVPGKCHILPPSNKSRMLESFLKIR